MCTAQVNCHLLRRQTASFVIVGQNKDHRYINNITSKLYNVVYHKQMRQINEQHTLRLSYRQLPRTDMAYYDGH